MKRSLTCLTSMFALAAGTTLAVPATTATAAAARPASPAAYRTFPGRLYGVAAISARNVWAVGLTPSSSLIVHWNGSAWSQSVAGAGYYEGVAASSARDVWAVGGTNWFSPSQTFAEHWNGSSWSHVATPNPAVGGYFNDVAATSAGNAWAVGLATSSGPGGGSAVAPLIEHWNGKHWTIQNLQRAVPGGQFDGVAATSSSNAWAVGWTGANQTLIEHWNGKTWTRVPSPNEGTASYLRSVTVISSDNAWAVGSYIASDGTNRTVTLYWNGVHWTVVPSQAPGGDAAFIGVVASWTRNIWAVGIRNPTRCSNGGPQCKTLVEHWDGTHWTLVASPNPPSAYLNVLWSIAAVSRTDMWAVGTTDYGSTLIVHWNGSSWS
jgi:hypothetical protein